MAVQVSPVNTQERRDIGLKPGDTVRVWQKVQEKGKTRLQPFEGIVLARKHGSEAGATFTVRRISGGVGVEKIFPLYSPVIDRIEIVRRAKVRRAKLYYIRKKVAREIKRHMRNMAASDISTSSDLAEQERKAKEAEEAQQAAEEESAQEDAQQTEGATAEETENTEEEKTDDTSTADTSEDSTEGEKEEQKS